jgi:quinol monooxygenase YgiN
MISRREFVLGAATLGTASLILGDEGKVMERFGMYGKMVAKPGQRDALVDALLEASRLVSPLPGCELYIVSTVPSEPDAVSVMEVWRTEADHDASLKLDSVRALITRARPLIAGGGDSVRVVPVGGKGLPA